MAGWLLQLSNLATSSKGASSGLADAILPILRSAVPLLVIVTSSSFVVVVTISPKATDAGDTKMFAVGVSVLVPLTLTVKVGTFDGMSKVSLLVVPVGAGGV